MHERFGQLQFADVLAPAIEYAENGFPVSPTVADLWGRAVKLYLGMRSDAQFEPWFTHFAPQNRAPEPGEIFRSSDIAATLKRIAGNEGRGFYRGEIAEKIAAFLLLTGAY